MAFIKNECENAVRADGKPLYEKMYGSIYILFKSSDGSEYIGTRNIPYANYDSIFIILIHLKQKPVLQTVLGTSGLMLCISTTSSPPSILFRGNFIKAIVSIHKAEEDTYEQGI